MNPPMTVTHVGSDGGIIINNGSCVSYVIYSDYSGRMLDRKQVKDKVRKGYFTEIKK